MSKKERILAALDAMGVGYCSKAACERDEMGVGISWEEILSVPVELLADMKNYYEENRCTSSKINR